MTQVARGVGPGGANRPGVALPIRIHDLLLTLAGRLDDDALADARQMLASAELDRSLEFVTGCLAAGNIALTGDLHRELESLFSDTYLDPSVIDRVRVTDRSDHGRHRFAVGAVDGREPDRGVADAVRPVLDVLPDVRSMWCVWRLTPSGPASGPVPHRLVLVGVGPAGFPPATAYRVEHALRRAGIRASVEVLVDGVEPTEYHREAMRNARQVPFDLHGSSRPRMEPVGAAEPAGRPMPFEAPRVKAARVAPGHVESPRAEPPQAAPHLETPRTEPPRGETSRTDSRFDAPRAEPTGSDSRFAGPRADAARSESQFDGPRAGTAGADSHVAGPRAEAGRSEPRFGGPRAGAAGSDSQFGGPRAEAVGSDSRFGGPRAEAARSEPPRFGGEPQRAEPPHFGGEPSPAQTPHGEQSRSQAFRPEPPSLGAVRPVPPPAESPHGEQSRSEALRAEPPSSSAVRPVPPPTEPPRREPPPPLDAPPVDIPVRKDPPFVVGPESPRVEPRALIPPAQAAAWPEPSMPEPQFEQERLPEEPPADLPPSALGIETRTDSAPSPKRRAAASDKPQDKPQDEPPEPPEQQPSRPRLAPAPNHTDRHSAAFVDDILNTQERNLLRELQDELARREQQESQGSQSGSWQIDRSGRHGKPATAGPFDHPNQTTGPMIINGVPPRPDKRGGYSPGS